MFNNHKISVVIPCYNEEKAIAVTISKIPKFVDEILVVDNNSTDNTTKIATKLGAKIVNEKKAGYGYALRAGIKSVKDGIVVTIDGDATYPIEDLEKILKFMFKNDFDFVSGARLPLENKEAMGKINIIGTKLINFFILVLFWVKTKDSLSGMWVFKKDIYNKLNLVSYDWNLSEEIKIEAARKFKYGEYHITHHIRLGETKLLKWRVGLENLIFLFWKRIFPSESLPKFLKLT